MHLAIFLFNVMRLLHFKFHSSVFSMGIHEEFFGVGDGCKALRDAPIYMPSKAIKKRKNLELMITPFLFQSKLNRRALLAILTSRGTPFDVED